jgi:hypothetical protein
MDEDRIEATIDRFEARLMVRFDAMERRFDAINSQLDRVETKTLSYLDEEKVAWERLLAEATAMRKQVEEINRLLAESRERGKRIRTTRAH